MNRVGKVASSIRSSLILLAAVQGAVCLYYARFALIDDAFIAFRYAVNLVQGHGLVYNLGEYVEGYTCFLWVLLLAIPAALHLDIVIAAKLLGGLFLLLTLIATARFLPDDPKRPAWSLLIAPALVSTNAAMALWAVHGLETSLFTFLVTAALRADVGDPAGERFTPGWSGVWYALATLTRPEGACLFGASTLFWTITRPKRLLRGAFWSHMLRYAVIVLPYGIWRYSYYGYLLPNTFYTKVTMTLPLVLRGGAYVLGFFGVLGVLLFLSLIPALAAAARDIRIAFLAWIVAAYAAVVALEGGDAFPAYRFMVPICPALYLLVQEGVHHAVSWARSREGRRRLVLAGVVIILVGAPLHAWRMVVSAQDEAVSGHRFTRDMTLAGLCLKRHLPATARIALNPAGAVPYYSGLYAYDMLGLTNLHIAHVPVSEMGSGFAGHEKGDGAYILDEAPDVILFGNVLIAPAGPVDFKKVRWNITLRSEKEIADDPRVTQLYVPDQLPLGDGRYLLFLKRRGFTLRGR